MLRDSLALAACAALVFAACPPLDAAPTPAFPHYEGLDTHAYLTIIPTPQQEHYTQQFRHVQSMTLDAPAGNEWAEIVKPFAEDCESALKLSVADTGDLRVTMRLGYPDGDSLPRHPHPDHGEGYLLVTRMTDGHVTADIRARTIKGAQHGLWSLRQLMVRWRDQTIVREATIVDWPVTPYRFVKRLGWWLDQAVRYRMNGGTAQLYNHAERDLEKFAQWAGKQGDEARRRRLHLLGMVAMGYVYRGEQALLERRAAMFRTAYKQGFTHLAMMNDDRPTLADPQARQRFGDYYQTQLAYARQVLAALRQAGYQHKLGFMPNHYYGASVRQDWLDAIGGKLPDGLTLFWAGLDTPGPTVTTEYLARIKRQAGSDALWFYTNWPQAARIQGARTVGPVRERAFGHGDLVELVTVSVDTRPERFPTSFISMADELWNPDQYDPERSLRRATKEVVDPQSYDAFYALFRYLDALAPLPIRGVANPLLEAKDFATRRAIIAARCDQLDRLTAACLATPASQDPKSREVLEGMAGRKQFYLDWLAGVEKSTQRGLAHKKIVCPKVDSAPVLDGVLDDAVWKQAAVARDFTDLRGGKPAPQQTVVRMMRCGDRLFFGITCDEPAMDESVFGESGFDYPVAIDNAPGEFVWWSESVELFLDPGQDQKRVHQLIVNVWGMTQAIVYDTGAADEWGHMEIDDEPPAIAVTGKVSKQADSWTLEFSLPISAVGAAEATGMWGFNVARNRRIAPKEHPGIRYTTWTPLNWGFGDAHNFGDLTYE